MLLETSAASATSSSVVRSKPCSANSRSAASASAGASAASYAPAAAATGKLPEAVAAAVIEFLTTTLIDQPARVGKPLQDDLAGIWPARRGTYRVLYRIREDVHEVVVLRVEHRRDAYRPL